MKWPLPFTLLSITLLQLLLPQVTRANAIKKEEASAEANSTDEVEIVLAAADKGSHSGASSIASGWYFYEVDSAKSFRDAHISEQSWAAYQQFKEDTCRSSEGELFMNGRILNNSGSGGYFKWEEIQFHRELRKIILPETRDGSYSSLIGNSVLDGLDSRLFASTPESLCKAKQEDSVKELDREEKDRFEDYLINKVFTPH